MSKSLFKLKQCDGLERTTKSIRRIPCKVKKGDSSEDPQNIYLRDKKTLISGIWHIHVSHPEGNIALFALFVSFILTTTPIQEKIRLSLSLSLSLSTLIAVVPFIRQRIVCHPIFTAITSCYRSLGRMMVYIYLYKKS